MNIDTAASRCVEKLVGQNATVSDHDSNVRIVRREQLLCFFVFDPRWLVNREPARACKLFDWRGTYFITTSRGSIGLCPDRDDFMAIVDALPQGGDGSLGCPHEYYSHRIDLNNPDF